MLKKQILLLIFSLTIFSCSERKPKEEGTPSQYVAPKALDDSKSSSSFEYSSKRKGADIIEQLYAEVVDKDPRLKALNEGIQNIPQIKKDSLKLYYKYMDNNKDYWSTVQYYIRTIKDTTLRKEMKAHYEKLEDGYKKKTASHALAENNLKAHESKLHDQEILMKLVVTYPMMESYQQNEIPDAKIINDVIARYDTLIKETVRVTNSE